ncbi:hypothetical protein R5W24_001509 [Gemmata sp. JC717]|uniref:Uncharacterized protein n=1 Tax=Gemmata algarum TaxID=2975278 RepID=A0ABU5F2A8_9BACT|nr:hypothetical protein [Gemmata algarum]MDY3552427.1 hypothetical protein [Gemmata algarum]MDY3561541.1 hypothetical protein [Gemmata algarum]
MPLTHLRDQVRTLADEFVHTAEFTGPRAAANVAALWSLVLLQSFPASPPPCRCLRMLSAARGRPATGADVLQVLSSECYVPPPVAEIIFRTFGGPCLRAG